jgi:sugar/nucleoside kinase (ribokinase family)
MARPDPDSEAGKVNWRVFLQRVLPLVDVFLPSFEELLYMLDRSQFEHLHALRREGDLSVLADSALLNLLAEWCLEAGAAMVVLKLGEQGLYLRTSRAKDRLAQAGNGMPDDLDAWRGRELLAPCFQANVAGTTGAGDATIAGFLTGLLNSQSPEETMTTAVAVGASSVEALDASSGVPSLALVQERVVAGWKRCPVAISLPGWRWDTAAGLWYGPGDQAAIQDTSR